MKTRKINQFNLLFTFLIMFFGCSVSAQGGFGGLTYKLESVASDGLMSIGGGGAWLITDNFYLGGAGFGSINSITIRSNTLSSLGYGGPMIGYKRSISPVFSLGGQVMLGSGGYTYGELEEDFGFVEPALQGWVRINHYMKLNIGIQYRLPFMDAENSLRPNDLDALGMQISLYFGGF